MLPSPQIAPAPALSRASLCVDQSNQQPPETMADVYMHFLRRASTALGFHRGVGPQRLTPVVGKQDMRTPSRNNFLGQRMHLLLPPSGMGPVTTWGTRLSSVTLKGSDIQ